MLRVQRDHLRVDPLRIADPARDGAIGHALDIDAERRSQRERLVAGQSHLVIAEVQCVPGRQTEDDVVVGLLGLRNQIARGDPGSDRRDLRGSDDLGRTDLLQTGGRGREVLVRRILHGDDQTAAGRVLGDRAHGGVVVLDDRPLQLDVTRHGVQRAATGAQHVGVLRSECSHPGRQPLVDRRPLAVDNGALDHPPSHKEGN